MTARRTDHFLTTLKRTRLPGRHLTIDTEAHLERRGSTYRHRFACAAAREVAGSSTGEYRHGFAWTSESPRELWRTVDQATRSSGHLVVWAHNLAYDLRVSDALKQLVARGWRLETISLAKQATWCAWRDGPVRLTLVDSFSWLPGPLGRIVSDLGDRRPGFDYSAATSEQLRERCQQDADTLAAAVAVVLNYLRSEDLGPFRPTGSGQSHAALRKRFLPERSIRVHTDALALAAEREAMHAGRCEAWRHGKVAEPLREVDMSLAYCRIAAACALPGELVGQRADLQLVELRQLSAQYAVLAELDVTCDVPAVPVTTDDGVIWPVGSFQTVLWEPELELVWNHAHGFTVRRAWLYKRTDALAPMARWLIERLEEPGEATPPVVKRMLKHWARTLVGRCGLRYRSWEPFGSHPRPELCISHEADWETGEVHENLRIGRQMLQLAALTESHSSVPAIPSWVASRCRANLWTLIEAAGPSNVAYMDTDGLLCTTAGLARLDAAAAPLGEVDLRHKALHQDVTIYGPRNVDLGTERRLSGVPRRAIARGELTFDGETWSGLQSALEAGHVDYVEVASRRWEVTPSDHRRVHLPDGTTEPIRLEDHA